MTTYASPREARELGSDNRGAIIVVGTFMAIFLTATLFYVMGTGEAIIFRERVQDAADAIAFSSAGVHARGMNLIALVNMIMAAILAVLVALKMLQMMTVILTTISCVICAIPFGQWACGFCSAGVNFEPKLQQAIDKYEKVVDKVLPLLSRLQRVVAWTTPYVGLAKSQGVAERYAPTVTGGVMISPSMVPCVPGGCDDGKLGLPVQEDTYANLCRKSGEYVADIAFFWMKGPLAILKQGLTKFAGWLTGTFPGYFCGGGGVDGGASGLDGASANLEDLAKKACTATEKGEKDKYEQDNGSLDGFNFDMKKCEKDKQKEFKGEIDKKLGPGAGSQLQGSLSVGKMTPKKIYEGAKHGGFYFQVYGFANADSNWPRRTDKGILIATKAGGMSVPNGLFNAMRFAQAEFYFDRPGSWDNNEDQAMWELAWRARLRRVRPMAPDVAEFTFGYATGKLSSLIGPQITQQLLDGDFFKFVMGQGGFDFAAEWLQNQAGDLGSKLDGQLEEKLAQTSWEIVH